MRPNSPSKDRGRVQAGVTPTPDSRVFVGVSGHAGILSGNTPPLPLNCGEMRSAGGTLWVGGGSQERRGSEEDGIGGVLLPLFPQGVHFLQSLHRWILWTLWRFYGWGGCFQVAVPSVGQVGTCVDVLEAAGGYLGRRSLSQPNRGASGGNKGAPHRWPDPTTRGS